MYLHNSHTYKRTGSTTILKTAGIIISSPSTNEYAILYCSGPWYRYIIDFFLTSPLILLLGLGFVILSFFSKKLDDKIIYFAAAGLVYYLFLSLFAKNIRYAMLLDIPLRLFAVSMVLRLTENIPGRYARLYAPLIILALAVYDYASFYNLFIASGIYDPVHALLLGAYESI